MSNTGSLGLCPCPGSKHSLASPAPIFTLLCYEKPRLTAPESVLCRQGISSTFITLLSSLLRKRAQGVSDVVPKAPGVTGTAWPFCTRAAPAAWHSQTHPPTRAGDLCPGLNGTLKFHLLNCLPSCLPCFAGTCFTRPEKLKCFLCLQHKSPGVSIVTGDNVTALAR